jgi:FAD/FMN-containing dehydrogenase
MGGIRDGVLIDMRTLNSMTLDREALTVTVGGGVITDDFVRFCQSHHLEVTVGSCPTTGLLGVSFGAGLGRLQGKYGYLHDNLISARLVLADGSLVTVSKEENPDLFYAVRGAGHNFGIAVEATFRVYEEANRGEHYSWDLEYQLDQCEDVFTALNVIMDEGMPPDLAVFVLWQRESQGGRKASPPLPPLDILQTKLQLTCNPLGPNTHKLCLVWGPGTSRTVAVPVHLCETGPEQWHEDLHLG